MSAVIVAAAVVIVAMATTPALALHSNNGLVTDYPLTNWLLRPSNSTATTFTPVPVTVPNTVVGALVESKYYDFDPFYGENLARINPADFDAPWTYATTFSMDPSVVPGSAVLLYLDGVNYRANVTLNGVVVGDDKSVVGALQRFLFDVTAAVNLTGMNTLEVSCQMPRRDPGQWRNAYPDLALSFDDWAPHPPDLNMGLWRPVGLRVVAPPSSKDASSLFTFEGFVAQTSLGSEEGPDGDSHTIAYVNFSVAVIFHGSAPTTGRFFIDISSLIGAPSAALQHQLVREAAFGAAGDTVRLVWSWVDIEQLVIPHPPLWWPWQMQDSRPLFNATVGVVESVTRARLPSATSRFALREAASELTSGGALQFYINRVAINIRGGGWAPDLFQRTLPDRRITDFVMMRDMGLNAIRLEGMMLDALFFDLADEAGMLVTPGFGCCDGWQHWARWPQENYVIAPASLRAQVRRLASHPSVIAFLLSSDELPPVAIETTYREALRDEAWPNVVISSASQQSSYVSGPSGVKMVGPYSWVPPSYWLEDGDGLLGNGSMNFGGAWGYLTEGGPGEAPMTFNSWNRTVPAEWLWNATTRAMDPHWSYHMGCPYGHFRNLTYYQPPLDGRYGVSDSAETFLYRSQAANLEGIKAMYEGYTRNKHINATGVIQWQIKAAWPNHLWHLYDWYFVSGGGYYGAKRALEHLHVLYSYTDGSVWMVNSAFDEIAGPIVVSADVVDTSGASVWTGNTTVTVLPPDASLDLSGDGLLIPMEKITAALPDGSMVFVRLEWFTLSSTAPADVPTQAAPATNWYWISKTPDVMVWANSSAYRTPCSQWADFSQLNALPPAKLSWSSAVSVTGQRVPEWSRGGGATSILTVNITNSGTSVVFLVHVHAIDAISGHDIAPLLCDDNFFSLLPRETKTIRCAALHASVASLAAATVMVETYNDVVGARP